MKNFRIFLVVAMVLTIGGLSLATPQAAKAYTPSMTGAGFIDSDHNGTIDRVKVTFDSNVSSCQFEAGDWTIGSGSIGLIGPTGRLNGAGTDADCDGTTNYFYLLVSGNANTTGYPAGMYVTADIQYRNQGTLGSVKVLGVTVPTQTTINVNDSATPVLRSDGVYAPVYTDADHNGAIDHITLSFTEPVNFSFNSSDWAWTTGNLTGFSPTGYSSGSGSSAITLNATASAGITGVGTGTAPTLRYAMMGTGVQDLVGNAMVGSGSATNISDEASPVIISSTPAAGSTGVSVNTPDVVIMFSEPMQTSSVSVSIGAGSWESPTWDAGNKTITYHRMGSTLPYLTAITVSASGNDTSGFLVTNGVTPAEPNPWSFTTGSAPADTTVSATQSTVSASPTSVIANGSSISVVTATVKNSSGSPLSGKVVSLASSRGSLDTVVSMTGATGADGVAYFQVHSSTAGTSTYTATSDGTTINQTATVTFTTAAPTPGPVSSSRSSVLATPASVVANNSDYSTVYVTVRDSSDNLLSGKSVTLYSSRGSSIDTLTAVRNVTDSSGQAIFQVKSATVGTATLSAVASGTAITPTSSVTFTAASAGLVHGDVFKESGSTAVYYYADNGLRYVFPTQAIYFSWYPDFSTIKTVSHSTITSVTFGGNVIAKPGTYLVQFVSMDTPFRVLDPKVYVLTSAGQLRWITSASVAVSLYGADWERKIVAVPEVYKTNYGGAVAGADVASVSDYSKASVEAAARTVSDLY